MPKGADVGTEEVATKNLTTIPPSHKNHVTTGSAIAESYKQPPPNPPITHPLNPPRDRSDFIPGPRPGKQKRHTTLPEWCRRANRSVVRHAKSPLPRDLQHARDHARGHLCREPVVDGVQGESSNAASPSTFSARHHAAPQTATNPAATSPSLCLPPFAPFRRLSFRAALESYRDGSALRAVTTRGLVVSEGVKIAHGERGEWVRARGRGCAGGYEQSAGLEDSRR